MAKEEQLTFTPSVVEVNFTIQPTKFDKWVPKLKDATYYLWTFASYNQLSALDMPFSEKLAWGAAVAAGVYLVGHFSDLISTIRVLEMLDQADKAGVKHRIIETNPFLPERPTLKEMLFNRRIFIRELAIETIGILVPPLGIGAGAQGIAIAANHERLRLRVKRKIDEVQPWHNLSLS